LAAKGITSEEALISNDNAARLQLQSPNTPAAVASISATPPKPSTPNQIGFSHSLDHQET
jgi:hypothetical protein